MRLREVLDLGLATPEQADFAARPGPKDDIIHPRPNPRSRLDFRRGIGKN
jgi:hypothetical protein